MKTHSNKNVASAYRARIKPSTIDRLSCTQQVCVCCCVLGGGGLCVVGGGWCVVVMCFVFVWFVGLLCG